MSYQTNNMPLDFLPQFVAQPKKKLAESEFKQIGTHIYILRYGLFLTSLAVLIVQIAAFYYLEVEERFFWFFSNWTMISTTVFSVFFILDADVDYGKIKPVVNAMFAMMMGTETIKDLIYWVLVWPSENNTNPANWAQDWRSEFVHSFNLPFILLMLIFDTSFKIPLWITLGLQAIYAGVYIPFNWYIMTYHKPYPSYKIYSFLTWENIWESLAIKGQRSRTRLVIIPWAR